MSSASFETCQVRQHIGRIFSLELHNRISRKITKSDENPLSWCNAKAWL